jgi:hypothetical protein
VYPVSPRCQFRNGCDGSGLKIIFLISSRAAKFIPCFVHQWSGDVKRWNKQGEWHLYKGERLNNLAGTRNMGSASHQRKCNICSEARGFLGIEKFCPP